MAKFNLVTVRPKGFLHASAFDDVKSSLAWSLAALGHEAMSTENAFSSGAQLNIIFGSELLPREQPVPQNSVLYNLEQSTHPGLEHVRRLALVQKLPIWDYSLANVTDWQGAGISAIHVPIGYTPNLTRVPQAEKQDIDVCFLGWMTPRRTQLIEQLKTSGLNVYASDCCYGGARDQILSRSKVCLNVNHDGRTLFNIVRVSFLLANSKCVVSENFSDEVNYPWLNGAIAWCDYSKLVQICEHLADPDSIRFDYEEAGLKSIQSQDFTATVAHALQGEIGATININAGSSVISPVNGTSAKLLDRYKRGCLAGDMKDFLPWLREHAQGKILEIGTRDGASTSAFLLGIEEHGGHLTSIDTDDCSKLWTHPQWTFYKASSLNLEFPDATFDLILIDGSHDRAVYIGDLYNSYHWAKPGALILSHDIVPERGHEFYAVALREEFYKFAVEKKLVHYELPGKYGMGVMQKLL